MCLVLFLPRFISLCYLVRDTYGVVKLPSKKACPSLLRHHQIRLKQSKNKKIERFFPPFPCTENIWWKPRRYLNCLWRFCSHFYGVVKKKPGITWQILFFLQVSVGGGARVLYNKPDEYDRTNIALGTSATNCADMCYEQTSVSTFPPPLHHRPFLWWCRIKLLFKNIYAHICLYFNMLY